MEKAFVPDLLCEWRALAEEDDLAKKLARCEKFLESWSRQRCNVKGKDIEKMRKERNDLMARIGDEDFCDDLNELTRKIEEAVEIDAIHWKQRSRTNWLANGDRNSSMFHAQATRRRKRNEIREIVDDRERVWSREEDKAKVIKDFFANLFCSTAPTKETIERVTETVEEQVGEGGMAALSKAFDAREVKRALFEMHPTKSPGPDGFNARFFQKFWPAMEEEVTKVALAILNEGANVSRWNETLICLIPKVQNPRKVEEFRPLSLCNTTYKIVSKVIANRIRMVLGEVIDPAQSAFIKGRLITDNILLSFECQHWLRNRRKGKDGFSAMKIDMSKAYDRVE